MIEFDKILRLQSLMTEYQRIIDENGRQWTPVDHADIIGNRIKKIYQGMSVQEKEWYNEHKDNLTNINLTLTDLPNKIEQNKLYFPFYDSYSNHKQYFGNYMYPTRFIDNSNQHLYKFIPIQKNASFWAGDILQDLGWNIGNIFEKDHNLTQEYNIVILRDPITRWCSGITSYLRKHHWMFASNIFKLSELRELTDEEFTDFIDESPIIQLLFQKVSFDLSTERQIYFLHNLDPKKTVYFYLDENFSKNFAKFFKEELKIENDFDCYPPENVTFEETQDTPASILCRNFHKVIDKDPFYLNALKKYYEKDFNFIDSVKFYT